MIFKEEADNATKLQDSWHKYKDPRLMIKQHKQATPTN